MIKYDALNHQLDADSRARYVKAARRIYTNEGTIEIDDKPSVSVGEGCGAYVAAWVWVDWEVAEYG